MHAPELAQKLVTQFPGASLVALPEKFVRDPAAQVMVPPQKLREVAAFIKDDKDFLLDFPNHMTAVDYIKENVFELVYYFYSIKNKHGLTVKTRIPRSEPEIDTLSDLWNGFDFQEREVYDLMGIKFKGHKNLKRIMMWEGFPG